MAHGGRVDPDLLLDLPSAVDHLGLVQQTQSLSTQTLVPAEVSMLIYERAVWDGSTL